jgi:hypothetical protein
MFDLILRQPRAPRVRVCERPAVLLRESRDDCVKSTSGH